MTNEEAIKTLMYDISLVISRTVDGTPEKIEQATKCSEALVLAVRALNHQKIGKWIPQKGGGFCCSNCKSYSLHEIDGNYIHVSARTKYCHNCGAKMEVENGSSN